MTMKLKEVTLSLEKDYWEFVEDTSSELLNSQGYERLLRTYRAISRLELELRKLDKEDVSELENLQYQFCMKKLDYVSRFGCIEQ